MSEPNHACAWYECDRPATVRLSFAGNRGTLEPSLDYCRQHADVVTVRVAKPNARTGRVVRDVSLV